MSTAATRGRRLSKIIVLALVLVSLWLVLAPSAQAQDLPYREITEPAGEPVGAMLVVHGGGWIGGPGGVAFSRPHAERFAAQGWLVWNVDFRSGAAALDDVRMWHGLLDAETDLPICAYGGSSGGHLALMLAVHEAVNCVVSDAGPTDLATLPDPLYTDYVVPAFGTELDQYSPLQYAQTTPSVFDETQILMGHWVGDRTVPIDQSERLAAELPNRATLHALDGGPAPFVHGSVDRRELWLYRRAESRLLSSVAVKPKRGGRGLGH